MVCTGTSGERRAFSRRSVARPLRVGVSKMVVMGQGGVELAVDAGEEADEQDGVAAKVEEVVFGADGLDAEDFGPDAGEPVLLLVEEGGGGGGGCGGYRGGEALAVELAVRGEGEGGQLDEIRRQHVAGEAAVEEVAEFRGCGRGAFGNEVSAETVAAGGVGPDAGGGDGDVGVCVEVEFDLAQLDAVAADLDLVVDAAQALDGAVGAEARRGRRCGRCARPSAKGSATNLLGGELGAAAVAAGDAVAADVELAGDADGDGLLAGVEDVERWCWRWGGRC